MEENKTVETVEVTEVKEVKEKKPVMAKVKAGATKVWNVVKMPLCITGALAAGAFIALTGVAYERANSTPDYYPEPEEPNFDEEATYREASDSETETTE